jgi:hypothetical protein
MRALRGRGAIGRVGALCPALGVSPASRKIFIKKYLHPSLHWLQEWFGFRILSCRSRPFRTRRYEEVVANMRQ